MAGDLRDRVVLTTGAARGIGEHTARLAAARGARLALVGLEPERLAPLAGELGGQWAECDVTGGAPVTQPEAEVRALGRSFGGHSVG